MPVAPSTRLNLVGELFTTLFDSQALTHIGKTIAQGIPKQALQHSVKLSKNAWNTTTESISKHLRSILHTSSSPVNSTPRTLEEISKLQEQIANLGTGFKQKMSAIEVKKDLALAKLNLNQAELEKLKELIDKIKSQNKPRLSDLLDADKTNTFTNASGNTNSEIVPEDPTLQEQIDLLQQEIETHFNKIIPRQASSHNPTHHVAHSAAPSWLALLLDSTYEPNYIEKLVELALKYKDKGIEGLQDKFNEEALNATENPLKVLTDEGTFKTIPDTSAYAVADVASMFLGVLSLVRGYEEFKEAKHELKALKKESTALKEDAKNIQVLTNILKANDGTNDSPQLPDWLQFYSHLNTAKIDSNTKGQKAAQLNKETGAFAMAAGFTSGLKGLSDITVKTGLAIKSLATGHGLWGAALASKSTAAVAATTTGAASTIALGPLAGLFAVGLGAAFTRKTSIKLNQLKKDFTETQTNLKGIAEREILHSGLSETQKTSFSNYKAFIEKQGEKRINFFSGFKKWNKAFLVGAGLYTASSAAKAGVIVASLLGATAAASNPVGWGVLTGVGIAAAIGLGISTLGFIKGHVRQTRYNQQTAGDHALVDRHFLVNAQNWVRSSGSNEDGSASSSLPLRPYMEGLNLAGSNLEMLNHRADKIKAFLGGAAKNTNSISPDSEKLNVLQRLRGNTLGKTKLNGYLTTKDGFDALINNFVKPDLEAQSKYIQQKLDFRLKHKDEHQLSPEHIEAIAQSPDAPQAIQAYQSHLERMARKATMDIERLKQVSQLKQDLQTYLSQSNPDNPSVEVQAKTSPLLKPIDSQTIKQSLLKHWGAKLKDKHGKNLDDSKVDKLFAKQLLHTLRKDVKMAQGVLFEAQLEATHMNNLKEKVA